MKAYLFDDYMVEISDRAASLGGSFQAIKNGLPAAWDASTLRFFYEETLKQERVEVLDIGANTGSFTLLAALHPNMHVVAFEPNPEVAEILLTNCELNGLDYDKVITSCQALGDKQGIATLSIPTDRQSGLATLSETPHRFSGGKTEQVEVTTLDALMLPADFIKIDTEGSELAILRGGERTIRDWRPKMLIEYYAPNTRQFGYEPSAITDLLESWGASWKHVGIEDIWVWWE